MIVGISGSAGAGKDAAADFLVRDFGFARVALADPLKRFIKDVFDFEDDALWGPSEARSRPDLRYPRPCRPCRQTGKVAVGGTVESETGLYVGGAEKDCELCEGLGLLFLDVRYAAQKLGTEWGRDCFDSVWVWYALRMAKEVLSGCYVYSPQEGLIRTMSDVHGVVIPDVRFRNEIVGLRQAGAVLIRIVRPGAGLQGEAAAHLSEAEQSSICDEEFDAVILNDGNLSDLQTKVVETVSRLRKESR